MKTGDVIVKVGNMNVNNVPQLQEQVGKFSPGDRVAVSVLRNGREQIIDMQLRGREGSTTVASTREVELSTVLGAEMKTASAEELKALRIGNGVKVVNINGGKLRSAGIREGFVITKIDDVRVREPKDVLQALEEKRGGVLIEGVYPNGQRAYYGLGV